MQPPVDLTKLVACADVEGGDADDAAVLREMFDRARTYVASFDWCDAIRECYVGDIAIGGVVAVLLFRIQRARPEVDEWLWAVVGDVPPAYLVTDDAPDSASALRAYIDEMERWVAAAREGAPVDDLIPVTSSGGHDLLEPTPAVVDQLAKRLEFLRANVLAG